jgi:hypothetical protein
VVSVTDLYGRILGFLDRSRYIYDIHEGTIALANGWAWPYCLIGTQRL